MKNGWEQFCEEYDRSNNSQKTNMRSSLSEEQRLYFDQQWEKHEKNIGYNNIINATSDIVGQSMSKVLPERINDIIFCHATASVIIAIFFPKVKAELFICAANIYYMYYRINGEIITPKPNKNIITFVAWSLTLVVYLIIAYLITSAESGLSFINEALLVGSTLGLLTRVSGWGYYESLLLKTERSDDTEFNFLVEILNPLINDPMKEIRVYRDKDNFKSYNFDLLRILIIQKKVKATDFLWHEGLNEMKTVKEYFSNSGPRFLLE